jgi:radical SAM superfamily enzyme YgiQ (UPF0313 family)
VAIQCRAFASAFKSHHAAMNICLISAPTASRLANHPRDELAAARIMGELAPVGILSLAAVLETEGYTPVVVDLNRVYYSWCQEAAQDTDFGSFAGEYFAGLDCELFGFSTVCSSYPLTLRIAGAVKRRHPRSLIVLGGPQASVVDVATMKAFPAIDVVVRGEAEQSLPELVGALAGNNAIESVRGITFRRQHEIARNPDAPLIQDLDALPFPAFHLFPDVRCCRHFPLELGRGCPFACTFCSTNDFFRRKFRLKSPPHMIDEMRRVKQTYGINSFELVHDMFTVDRKRVVAFCEAILESKEEFYWGCSARTDCVDEELIALMAKAGCRGIFFGIESGSRRMQRIIDKGLDLDESENRIRACDKHQINTAVSLMAGFPEETTDDLRRTAGFFVDSLRYDYADPQLSILAPLAGTPIHKQHQDSLTLSDDVSDMSYRGWPQTTEDHALIAAYPEIFSSFYATPLSFVESDLLKELRDFLLTGSRAFRRLLLGLQQDSGNILEVFQQWREWRKARGLRFANGDRSAFYAHGSFPGYFLDFVRLHYIPNASTAPLAISTLAEYEAALSASRQADEIVFDELQDTDDPTTPSPDTRPRLLPGVNVIELATDYKEIVRRLQEKTPLDSLEAQPSTLVVCRLAAERVAAWQLSPLSAELLELCEANLTLREITAEFQERRLGIPGVPPDQACLAGIEILRQQRLIALS